MLHLDVRSVRYAIHLYQFPCRQKMFELEAQWSSSYINRTFLTKCSGFLVPEYWFPVVLITGIFCVRQYKSVWEVFFVQNFRLSKYHRHLSFNIKGGMSTKTLFCYIRSIILDLPLTQFDTGTESTGTRTDGTATSTDNTGTRTHGTGNGLTLLALVLSVLALTLTMLALELAVLAMVLTVLALEVAHAHPLANSIWYAGSNKLLENSKQSRLLQKVKKK